MKKTMAARSLQGLLHSLVFFWSLYIHLRETEARILQEEAVISHSVTVNTSSIVASIDDNFLCATIDWWPSTKCSTTICPWGEAGLLNLDLDNPVLHESMKELKPYVRAGGTLENIVVYQIGPESPGEPCLPFQYNDTALYDFTGGCLSMERWDKLNSFFMETGVSVAFGLNALYGRDKNPSIYNITTVWDWTNAFALIQYTREKGYPVTGWQLGNELMGRALGKRVNPTLYTEDIKNLERIVEVLYNDFTGPRPLIIAPDSLYTTQDKDLPSFLQSAGTQTLNAVTTHSYNLGGGEEDSNILISNIMNRIFYENQTILYKALQDVLKAHPETQAWIGESGGIYGSGRHGVSDTYINAFWYLDQLGTASLFNNKVFCRQSFVGGNYALIDRNTFEPNPDYYGALLWRRLMGNNVLPVDVGGNNDTRAYAHCEKGSKGGVTVLILNYSNVTTSNLDFKFLGSDQGTFRHEYHLSPANGNITSQVVLLNDKPLLMTGGKIPTLSPVDKPSSEPISLKPLTYAYLVFPDVHAPVCV